MSLYADHDELTVPWARSDRLVPRTLAQPLQQFLDTEAASGVVLLVAAVVAVGWASSPWSGSYEALWAAEVTMGAPGLHITESLGHWVNDLAMAFFFFVAGLEIKRELVHGDLRQPRTAMLPILCAFGGMVVPALLYLAVNAGGRGADGWGIPMATDIAFSIGVLALVGRRVPASLKVFLLTLAIVDDIGAILVIAAFYSAGIDAVWLTGAALIVVTIVVLRRAGIRSLVPYAILAAGLWLATFESGIHATIAGVVLALLTPAKATQPPGAVAEVAIARLQDRHLGDGVDDERDETSLLEVSALTAEAASPLGRLERLLHPYTSFVILPLFALANAGIDLTGGGGASLTSPVAVGIVLGLLVGKPVGIVVAAWLATRLFKARLPVDSGWVELAGVGMLAGIGFTVSLFVTSLAFDGQLAADAKVAILAASTLAGVVGASLLLLRPTSTPLTSDPGSEDA